MLRFLKTASKVTVGLLSGATVAFAAVYVALTVLGYKPVAVYSGSMEPTIHVGGLALDRAIPSKNVRVGDVITFSDPYVKGRLVTHRVIHVLETPHGTRLSHERRCEPGTRSVDDSPQRTGRTRLVQRPGRRLHPVLRSHPRGARLASSARQLSSLLVAHPRVDLAQRSYGSGGRIAACAG